MAWPGWIYGLALLEDSPPNIDPILDFARAGFRRCKSGVRLGWWVITRLFSSVISFVFVYGARVSFLEHQNLVHVPYSLLKTCALSSSIYGLAAVSLAFRSRPSAPRYDFAISSSIMVRVDNGGAASTSTTSTVPHIPSILSLTNLDLL